MLCTSCAPSNITRLWADALCINQTGEEEKGRQIRYMKHIYARAEETYAWLGKGESHVCGDALFFFHTMLLEQTRLEGIPHSHPDLPPGHIPVFEESNTRHRRSLPNSCQRCLFEKDFQALVTLFGQEYWKRRWIIQEIAATSRVQILCGSERIAFDEMELAVSKCRSSCYWLNDAGAAYYYVEKAVKFRRDYQANNRPPLVNAIRLSRHYLSTDNRDKILALLGICEDGAELVPEEIGYQYPAEIIAANITKALIQKTGYLDFILINSKYEVTQSEGTLPTWTPDWVSPKIPSYIYLQAKRPRKAQRVLSSAELPIGSGILRVQGAIIGKY